MAFFNGKYWVSNDHAFLYSRLDRCQWGLSSLKEKFTQTIIKTVLKYIGVAN